MGQGPIIRVGGNSQEHTELYDTPFDDHYEITNKTLNTNPLAPVSYFVLSSPLRVSNQIVSRPSPPR